MNLVIRLLVLQGCLGAWDTLWYHEWGQRLAWRPTAKTELRLHASRDVIYAVLFGSLAWLEWRGAWIWGLTAFLLAEIVITLLDFVEEDRVRRLPAGERIMHALMGIVYGAFLAYFFPELQQWSSPPTRFQLTSYGSWSWMMTLMACGVLASGLRDIWASHTLSNAGGGH